MVMDIVTFTTFISPFLPFLLKLGGKAADKATETAAAKLGEASWKKLRPWKELSPKIEAKEAAKEAVEDVVNHPDNEKFQVALQVQLEKLLNQNETLLKTIVQILEDPPENTPSTQIIQNVKGDRNQVIGQMSGGQVSQE
jgi:hypothetical protein